jgi:drug/metabolite transporter (DMT)-like permease
MDRSAARNVALVATAWGLIGVLVRWTGLPTPVVVAGRCVLAAAVLGAFTLSRPHERSARAQRPWLVMVSGVVLAVHWLCLVGAQRRVPIGTVLLLTYLAPVVVALAAPFTIGEHVNRTTKVAVAVAFAGTVVLARPHGGGSPVGLAMAIAAGLTYAALTLLSKVALAGLSGAGLALRQLVVAGVVVLPFALTARWGAPRVSWWWLVVLGVVFTAGLNAVYLDQLARLPASMVGVLAEIEPVASVGFGWWLLHQRPAAITAVGGTAIVLAGMMVIRAAGRAPSPPTGLTDPVPPTAKEASP